MSDDDEPTRRRPNILITGTPGVGKTCTATLLAETLGMKHFNVGELIKQHKCHEGRDEELDTFVLDEDKLLDIMEPMVAAAADAGCVVDFYSCELFPERWFDLVMVLRATTEVLYDRLTARGYSEQKRSENITCEIMQVVLEEAREAYAKEIVQEVPSNSLEEMESNISRVQEWCRQWIADRESRAE